MGLNDADLKNMSRRRTDATVFMGVDLGKLRSHSAFVLLERFAEWPDLTDTLRGKGPQTRFVVRQAERFELGTEYRLVILRLQQVVSSVLGRGRSCVMVVDEGGPGVPVVERMREMGMGCSVLAYKITPGEAATGTTVPRASLLTKMQLMLQHGELEIAEGCRHGEDLVKELVGLHLTKSSSGSDDLALALALACWKARVRGW